MVAPSLVTETVLSVPDLFGARRILSIPLGPKVLFMRSPIVIAPIKEDLKYKIATILGSFPFVPPPPPRLVGAYYLHPGDTCHILT